MSITDELREWKRKLNTRFTPEVVLTMRCEINCIADRIDKTLEDYIELPKDADGVPIRVGDKMLTINGRAVEVDAIGVGLFMAWNPDDRHFGAYVANICHHTQSDSWERIIRDAQGDGILNQIDGRPSDFDALVERCKRLAGENA